MKPAAHTSKAIRLSVLVAGMAGLAVGFMAWQQVKLEHRSSLDDLSRRARAIAFRASLTVKETLKHPDMEAARSLGTRLDGHSRLLGLAVYRPDGRLLASGSALDDYLGALTVPVTRALSTQAEVVEMAPAGDIQLHILATPIRDGQGAIGGVLVALHDASYLDDRMTEGLVRGAFWILVITMLLMTVTAALTWTVYERPLRLLTGWMRRLRVENAADEPPPALPDSALATETDRLAASLRAARSSSWTASSEAVLTDKAWTRERLRAHAVECLHGDQLIVVSNREPYMHQLKDGEPRAIVPASGVVTAMDPVLQACGGVWIAHGAGDADHETSDAEGRLTVPPGDARYTLRRMWLTREEEAGYYYGFSNEGLWPLCHLVHERPVFRASDWEAYRLANRKFADAVLEETKGSRAMVLVQDYHLALVPQMLKASRPDLKVGIFWHIPWPNPEAFRTCPWRVEILQGMLGADLVGFHLQQHCNNFLDTVDRMLETRIDWDDFSVAAKAHKTLVRPFPISIQSWAERAMPSGEALQKRIADLKDRHDLEDTAIAVSVDRIDYTKGIPERLRAVERFFEQHPQHRGRITFVQLGAPSRTHIRRYRDFLTEIESLADEINWKLQTERWKPIRLLVSHHDAATVHAFLRMASICVVSSLHDGMNLVAKEYVSAREDGDGVLVLSEFAGAARDLPDALIVNPYDTGEFADALRQAVEMPPKERKERMGRMRAAVEERNIYRWAADLLTTLARTGKSPERKLEATPRVQ